MWSNDLPPQIRPVLGALAGVVRDREPAIRERVLRLRLESPDLGPEELARKLVRDTRRRVATTGAASGAAAIAPGLGTLIAVGTTATQSLYALEQETELVLAIAIIYGRELAESDHRLVEALVVIGLAGGAIKLRDSVLVAGGERITVAAFRRVPARWAGRLASDIAVRVLGRALARRTATAAGRLLPVAVGMALGAAFDWVAVSVLGRAAIRYYGTLPEPAQAASRGTVELPSPEDLPDVEPGD